MKNVLLPILLSIPFLLLGQGDDYCTCMEKQKEHDDIMTFVTSMNMEVSTMIPQSTTSVFMPQLAAEEESVFIVIPRKDEPKPKPVSEPQKVEKEMPKVYLGDSGKWKKTTAGKGQKRRKGKVKKRKKFKKYRGSCPFF